MSLDVLVNLLLHLGPGCQPVQVEVKGWGAGAETVTEHGDAQDCHVYRALFI